MIDGDTIEVKIAGKVYKLRYIGMDAPEVTEQTEYFGKEASSKNRELVAKKKVTLIKDVSETDRYGRLLRYVFVDNVFVNYELVRQGYALAVTYPPDVACNETFLAAERSAREEQVGMWKPQPTEAVSPTPASSGEIPTGKIVIVTIYYNGSGQNEPDEYVEICNDDSNPIQLQSWTLRDKARHVFTFPEFIIQPGQICRIYTSEVHPDSCGFNFHVTSSAIWNNNGDTAFLRDAQNNLIAEYTYP